MNRRDLLKGVAGLTAGLLLPSTVAENAAEARRYWALGAMPGDTVLTDDEINGSIIAEDYDNLVLYLSKMFGVPLITRQADGTHSMTFETTPLGNLEVLARLSAGGYPVVLSR